MPRPCAPRSTRCRREAGWAAPLFYETTVDDLGDDVTRQALEEGVDAVLVAGGDGTVRAVSEAMSGSGVPLAIVPSGTGNLLARNLFLPLDDPRRDGAGDFDGDTHPDRRRLRRAPPPRRHRARSARSSSWAGSGSTPR